MDLWRRRRQIYRDGVGKVNVHGSGRLADHSPSVSLVAGRAGLFRLSQSDLIFIRIEQQTLSLRLQSILRNKRFVKLISLLIIFIHHTMVAKKVEKKKSKS